MQTSSESRNQQIARNSIFMSIRMIIVLILTLYTTRIVLSALGVIDYGIYNVVCGFVAMFSFLNVSMSNGIQRFYNYELASNGTSGAEKVFKTAILIQLFIAIIILILTETIGLYYLKHKMIIPLDRLDAAYWVFQLTVLSFVFIIFQAPLSAVVIAHEKMGVYATIGITDAVLKLLIANLLMITHGDRLIVYSGLLTCLSGITLIVYVVYCKIYFDEIQFKILLDKSLFKSMLSFSGWNFFGSLSNILKEQGINLVLNLFYGPIVNAARGISYQVNSGLQSFIGNICMTTRPQIIQSYAIGNINRVMNLTYSVSKFGSIILYMIALPLAYEIDWWLPVWIGSRIPENTKPFIIITFLIAFVNQLNAAISNVVHATGRMKLYQISTSLTALSSIPLAYIALNNGFSAVDSLWIVFGTLMIAQAVALYTLKRLVKYSFFNYLKFSIFPFAAVAITTIWIPYVFFIYMDESWLRFLLVVVFSEVSILVSTYFIALNKHEKNAMLGILKHF